MWYSVCLSCTRQQYVGGGGGVRGWDKRLRMGNKNLGNCVLKFCVNTILVHAHVLSNDAFLACMYTVSYTTCNHTSTHNKSKKSLHIAG